MLCEDDAADGRKRKRISERQVWLNEVMESGIEAGHFDFKILPFG